MKKIFSLVVVLLISLIFVSVQVSAEENSNKEKHNEQLKSKGFDDSEIHNMSESVKEDIIKNDGEKAKYTIESQQYYNSLDGKRYKVTEDNKEKIDLIRQKDLKSKGMSESSVGINSVSNGETQGKWSANTVVAKIGSTSSEYRYKFYTDWFWSSRPNAYFTDTVATAWENDFTGLAGTSTSHSAAMVSYADGDRMIDKGPLDLQHETYGLEAKYDVGNYSSQTGGYIQEAMAPKRLSGETSSVVTKYLHPFSPVQVGLSIGPGSIESDSFWGNEWTYRVNVTIGE